MIGEGALYADSVKDLPHSEAGPGATSPDTDDNAIKHLRAFPPTFNNPEVDPDSVAWPKLSNIRVGLNIYY